jgi:hypothetical protein
MSDSSNGVYHVSYSGANLEQLRRWSDRAVDLGIGPAFAAALKTIHRKLTTDPLNWGDPSYRLHHLGLLVCHGIVWNIQAHYAVDEARRIVYVKDYQLLSGHPLGPEP